MHTHKVSWFICFGLSLDLLSTGSQPVNGASNSIKARWKVPTEWPGMWQITQISRKFSVFSLVWSGSGSWPAPDNGDMGTLTSPGSDKLSPIMWGLLWRSNAQNFHWYRDCKDPETILLTRVHSGGVNWRHNCVRSLLPGDQARLKLLVIIVYHREKLLYKWNFFVILYEEMEMIWATHCFVAQ